MENTAKSSIEKSQEYQLSKELQDETLQAKDNLKAEKNKSSVFSRPATYLTMLTTALTLTTADAVFSQTKDNNPEAKNVTINTLDYVKINVGKYYPTEIDYLQTLMAQINDPKLRDFVNACLQETVMKKWYTEPKLTAILIACIEQFCGKEDFFNKKIDANDPMIDDMAIETLNFDKVVKAKNAQINSETEQMKKENEEIRKQTALLKESIAQWEQRMKHALSTTTVQMIKTDKWMQDAVKTIFDYYVKYKIELTDHEKALRDALPKGTKGTPNK